MSRRYCWTIALAWVWTIVCNQGTVCAQQPATASAAQEPTAAATEVELKLNELDQQVAALTQQQQLVLDEAREARKRAADQDREWKSLIGQIDSVQTQQEELARQQKKVETANAAVSDAQAALTKAQEEFEAAKKKLEEAQAAVNKANEEAQNAAKPIEELQSQISDLQSTIPQVRESAMLAEAASLAIHREIEQIEARAATLAIERQARQLEIERLLRDAGKWISFSEQIAPIFHQHCVSCHNARNAKGQYNMANYAAMLAEGESGIAILPSDADASSLYQHVASGSMPYESEPLKEEQVELISRWIDAGARIETLADVNAPLIRLMPRVAQPAPPEVYRTALPITALAIDRSGTWLASAGYHEVLIWSLPEGNLIRRITNVAERVYGLDIHPDGQRMVVASGTPGQLGEVKLFDAQTGEMLADLLIAEDVQFSALFSPNGERVATVGADGSVSVFDLNNAEVLPLVIQDHADWINGISWSPDGRWLGTAARDKTAKVFDSASGALKLTFSEHGANVTQAVFIGNEQVVSSGVDRKLRLWNIADGKQVREIGGLGGEIVALLQLENSQLASIGSDSILRIHDTNEAKLLRESKISDEWSSSLTTVADHPYVYVGDQAGTIYQLNRGDLTRVRSWLAVP